MENQEAADISKQYISEVSNCFMSGKASIKNAIFLKIVYYRHTLFWIIFAGPKRGRPT